MTQGVFGDVDGRVHRGPRIHPGHTWTERGSDIQRDIGLIRSRKDQCTLAVPSRELIADGKTQTRAETHLLALRVSFNGDHGESDR